MKMPITMEWVVVTNGKEVRLKEDNTFSLVHRHYKLFPLNVPIEVKKTQDSETIGFAEIKELTWKNDTTTIIYELKKLKGVN